MHPSTTPTTATLAILGDAAEKKSRSSIEHSRESALDPEAANGILPSGMNARFAERRASIGVYLIQLPGSLLFPMLRSSLEQRSTENNLDRRLTPVHHGGSRTLHLPETIAVTRSRIQRARVHAKLSPSRVQNGN